jgi:hypothetical protein
MQAGQLIHVSVRYQDAAKRAIISCGVEVDVLAVM